MLPLAFDSYQLHFTLLSHTLRQLRARRRHRYGAHISALDAEMLLLSRALLYSHLSFFKLAHTKTHPFKPLLNDRDSETPQPPISTKIALMSLMELVSSFNRCSIEVWEDYVTFNLKHRSELGFGRDASKTVFGSDDVLVENRLKTKLSGVGKIEDHCC